MNDKNLKPLVELVLLNNERITVLANSFGEFIGCAVKTGQFAQHAAELHMIADGLARLAPISQSAKDELRKLF
jgi:hypothetical protein